MSSLANGAKNLSDAINKMESSGSESSGGGESSSVSESTSDTTSASSTGKNAKKMTTDEIGDFLNAGEDWHQTSAKTDFLNGYKKELQGSTNADFYIDRTTGEVFLKPNKGGKIISTGLTTGN
jgi:hypothetical protein